jgi:hypothetical protein
MLFAVTLELVTIHHCNIIRDSYKQTYLTAKSRG